MKPINLNQLEAELKAAGIAVPALGTVEGQVHTYDADGQITDLPAEALPIVERHVAMREKTPDEYAAEFGTCASAERKQEIRDIVAGLLPREQVPA